MKKSVTKITALCLSILTVISASASLAVNLNRTETVKEIQKPKKTSDIVNLDTKDKNETVYVIANADGSVKKILVSEWIANKEKADKVLDKTELTDIENQKDDFGYTIDDSKIMTWEAGSKDIYYKGTTDKALPVDVYIKYSLDGKDISANDLAGKSGKVKISFTYKNNEKKNVLIDGKTEEISVPFAMISGLVLDNDKFSNIEVKNGKIINDGDKTIAMGLALPGLSKNLAITADTFEIPEDFEITADVENFSLTTSVTIAANDLFNSINTDKITNIDDLAGSIGEMSEASDKLVNGSDTLAQGLGTLLEKSNQLITGVNTLYEGADRLAKGTDSLSNGSKELKSGMNALSKGLTKLDSNSQSITGGAKQVFETLLNTANVQIKAAGIDAPQLTIENYSKVLNGIASNLSYENAYNAVLEQVKARIEEKDSLIRAEVTNNVKAEILKNILASQNMTAEQYEKAAKAGALSSDEQNKISAAVEGGLVSAKDKIEELTRAQKDILIKKTMESDEIKSKLSTPAAQLEAGKKSITALLSQLDSYNTFYQGVIAYTKGVSSAKDAGVQLNDGAQKLDMAIGELNKGSKSLFDGILTLKNGSVALKEGVTKLESGSKELAAGMKTFDEKAVSKLEELSKGELKNIGTRLKATIDVSKDYQSFGGKTEDMSGSVKFIYRTESIEADK